MRGDGEAEEGKISQECSEGVRIEMTVGGRRKDYDNDHSGYRPQRGLLGRGNKKIKRRKKSDTARDVTEDNLLTPFNKGELREKQHCDMVIDTTIVFLSLCGFPLKSF